MMTSVLWEVMLGQIDLVLSHYHNYRPQYKLGGNGSVNGEAICGSPSNSTYPNPGHWNAMQAQNTYSAGGEENRPKAVALCYWRRCQ